MTFRLSEDIYTNTYIYIFFKSFQYYTIFFPKPAIPVYVFRINDNITDYGLKCRKTWLSQLFLVSEYDKLSSKGADV